MFCNKCGTQLSDDSRFCYKCGAPTYLAEQKDRIAESDYDPFDTPPATGYNPAPRPQEQPQPQPQQQSAAHDNNNTTDEGIFGLLGFILSFFFPILGLIFSIIGMGKKKNNGLATAGFILSIVFIILVIIIIVIAVEETSSTYPSYYYYT